MLAVHVLPRIWLRGFSPTRTGCGLLRNGKLTSANPAQVTCMLCVAAVLRALESTTGDHNRRLGEAFRAAHGQVAPVSPAEKAQMRRPVGRERRDRIVKCGDCLAPVWESEREDHECVMASGWDRKEVA